ncbi:hypothetical protein CPT_Metamorpho_012 [Klebsiella phage Metamorpho]|nr:hypothetical protein CPT_Metamorpho_012 [Klebsiella phage Metamorpho]
MNNLVSDIKEIIRISTSYGNVPFSEYVKGNIIVLDDFTVAKDYPVRRSIRGDNIEDGEVYTVVLDVYDDFFVLKLENGDEFLIFNV